MIDLENGLEYEFVSGAIKKARSSKGKQLISYTKQIQAFDPVKLFASFGKNQADRIFWGSTMDDFYLVGLGSCAEVNDGDKGLPEMEQMIWRMMESASIYNPFQTHGTGLVAFGGMTFDMKNQHKTLWNNFPHQSLRIPKWVVTKDRQTFYCTVNTYVTELDEVYEFVDKIQDEMKALWTGNESLGQNPPLQSKTEIQPGKWKATVAQAVEEIKYGKAQKIVLAREMNVRLSDQANIGAMLNTFRDTQENSYLFAIECNGDCFIGATPERLVRMDDQRILSTCLAGTISRGANMEEDEMLKDRLLQDTKNRKEHDFVVIMIRNALEKYCFDINIPEEPVIYPLKHLQHLYTPVRATLKQGVCITDIVHTLHPTPALGGVPREESLRFIRENELLERGWYGAPLGWLDSNRNGEFAVSIRSGLVKGDNISLFAGCGIMGESDPEAEYKETKIKFSPMLSVLEEEK